MAGEPAQPVATVVDGCVVHSDRPPTPDVVAALREVIAAVRQMLEAEDHGG